MPEDGAKLSDFRERAIAACNSAELLGIDTTPTEADLKVAESIVYAIAENELKVNTTIDTKKASVIRPQTYYAVDAILKEFSIRVVDNASQIRYLVTNKLVIESTNEDPRIRIRALELLGKITDVGLFTEKSEVTVTHRSTEAITESLRDKIRRLMNPESVTDVDVVKVNGEEIDLDKELGLEETPEPENTPVANEPEVFDDDNS